MKKIVLSVFLVFALLLASLASAAPHGAVKDFGPRKYSYVAKNLVAPWIGQRGKIKIDARLAGNVQYINKEYKLFVFAGRGTLSGHGAQVWFVCGPKVEDKPVCKQRVQRAAGALKKSSAILWSRRSRATLAVAWATSCGSPNDVIKLVPPCSWVKRFKN